MTKEGAAGPRWPHPLTGQLFDSPVPPGQGWPGDPAGPTTPVAHTPEDVARLGAGAASLDDVDTRVSVCRACPRLVEWRESVAVAKRKAFATQPYWGRPVTGWGEEQPRVVVVGLAPAVHGGNRTGRIFTGDRSGDWLFAALHRAGLARQAASDHAGDGQQLVHTRMVATVRCAPPDNKPTPTERDTCAPWLDAELRLVLPSARVIVCLGGFAWAALFGALARHDLPVPRPRAAFGHGARVTLGRSGSMAEVVDILGCYHPSQQNTFTGRLTEAMLDDLFGTAVALAGLAVPP